MPKKFGPSQKLFDPPLKHFDPRQKNFDARTTDDTLPTMAQYLRFLFQV